MSDERDTSEAPETNTEPNPGGWEGLAEWTGGLPPEEIGALTAVRPLEAAYPLFRGLAGRSARDLLARAAAVEALATSHLAAFTDADFDRALSWLAEPARSETLRALRRSGWLAADPGGGYALTAAGRQIHAALRLTLAALPETGARFQGLPGGLTPEQIVGALLTRSLEELAAAGRMALVPVLPIPPLLTTEAVVKSAEIQALQGRTAPEGGGQPS